MDRRGLWVVAIVASANAVAAFLLNPEMFRAGFNLSSLRLIVLSIVLPAGLWALWQPIILATAGHPAPIRGLRDVFSSQKQRILNVLIVMSLFLLNANSVAVFKTSIPSVVPFYADAMFTTLDGFLFGVDPWRISHRLLPNAALFFDRFYVTWFIGLYGSVAVLAFSTNAKKQTTGLLAFTLSWIILGQVFATLFSSVGPILANGLLGDHHFDPLLAELKRTPDLFALATAERLMGMDSGIGSGISAMPSMHVAMAVFWVLLTRLYWPRLWPLPAAYAVLIWIASIHLGWHYALDGIVSLVGVVIIWRLSERFAEAIFSRRCERTPRQI